MSRAGTPRVLKARTAESERSGDRPGSPTNLQTLNLYSGRSLTNVDVLSGLTNLQTLDLGGCRSLAPGLEGAEE